MLQNKALIQMRLKCARMVKTWFQWFTRLIKTNKSVSKYLANAEKNTTIISLLYSTNDALQFTKSISRWSFDTQKASNPHKYFQSKYFALHCWSHTPPIYVCNAFSLKLCVSLSLLSVAAIWCDYRFSQKDWLHFVCVVYGVSLIKEERYNSVEICKTQQILIAHNHWHLFDRIFLCFCWNNSQFIKLHFVRKIECAIQGNETYSACFW